MDATARLGAAEAAPRKHVPALDGVRGLAIILVIVYHCHELKGGWIGVDLFFVLSGFLITGILIRAREAPHYLRNFLGRRALRILPAYYAYLVVILVVLPALGILPSPQGQGWVWSYLTNARLARTGSWGSVPADTQHLWSVAVEEQFYLVWPLVVFWLSRKTLRNVCIAGIAVAVALRVFLYLIDWTALASYVLMPTRMDALLVGAWIAVAPWRRSWIGFVFAAVVFGAVLFLGVDSLNPAQRVYGYTLLALAGGIVLSATQSERWLARLFEWRPLRVAGKYSYTAYLIHPLILEMLRVHAGFEFYTRRLALLVLGLTFSIAWLSWQLLEAPILSLKRFFPEPPVPIRRADAPAHVTVRARIGESPRSNELGAAVSNERADFDQS